MEPITVSKTTKKQRLVITFTIIAFLLAIPLVAMQLSSEVNWKPLDFAIMGSLLTITGLAIELAGRKIKSTTWKTVVCLSVIAMFLLVWAELAVGLFGTPFAGH